MPSTNPVTASNVQGPSPPSAASSASDDSHEMLLEEDDKRARRPLSAGFQRLKNIVSGRGLFKKAENAPACRVSKPAKPHVNQRAAAEKRIGETWNESLKIGAEVILAAGMSPYTPGTLRGKPLSSQAAHLEFLQTWRAAVAYLEKNPTYASNKLLEKDSAMLKKNHDAFEKLKKLDPAAYYERRIIADTTQCVLDSLARPARHAPHNIARYTPIPDRSKDGPADGQGRENAIRKLDRHVYAEIAAQDRKELKQLGAVIDDKILAVKAGHPMAAYSSCKSMGRYIPDGRVPGGFACVGQMLNSDTISLFEAEGAAGLTAKLNELGAQWNAALEKSPQERVEALKSLYEHNQRVMKDIATAAQARRADEFARINAQLSQIKETIRPEA